MKAGAQIMAGLLHYGVQFLSPIPDEKETELARGLASDAHSLFNEIGWITGDLQGLFHEWFRRGREYESGTPSLNPIPSDVSEALKEIIYRKVRRFLERFTLVGIDLNFLCRLLWISFQWGRSYQLGNAA